MHDYNHPIYLLSNVHISTNACSESHDLVNIPLSPSFRGQMFVASRKSSFLLDSGSTFNLVSHHLYGHLMRVNSSVSYFNTPLHIKTGGGVVNIAKPKIVHFSFTFPGTNIIANMSALLVTKLQLPCDVVLGQSFLTNYNGALTMSVNTDIKPVYAHLRTKSMIHLRNRQRVFTVDLIGQASPLQGSIRIVSTNSLVRIVNAVQTIQPYQTRFQLVLESTVPDQEVVIRAGASFAKFKFTDTKTPMLTFASHTAPNQQQTICKDVLLEPMLPKPPRIVDFPIEENPNENAHTLRAKAPKAAPIGAFVSTSPANEYNRFQALASIPSNFIPAPVLHHKRYIAKQSKTPWYPAVPKQTVKNRPAPATAQVTKTQILSATSPPHTTNLSQPSYRYSTPKHAILNHGQSIHADASSSYRRRTFKNRFSSRRGFSPPTSSQSQLLHGSNDQLLLINPPKPVLVRGTPNSFSLGNSNAAKTALSQMPNKSNILAPGSVEYYTEVLYELSILSSFVFNNSRSILSRVNKGKNVDLQDNISALDLSISAMPKPDVLNMSLIATTSVRTCDQATQTDVCFYEVPNIYPEIYEQSMKGNDQIQYDALETFYDGLSKEDFLSNLSNIPFIPTHLQDHLLNVLFKHRRVFTVKNAPVFLRAAKLKPVEIVLKPNSPSFIRSRPFSGTLTQAETIETELSNLHRQGVLKLAPTAKYLHPVLLVDKKPDQPGMQAGSRLVFDIRSLNTHSLLSNQHLTSLDFLLRQVSTFPTAPQGWVKLDMTNSFHQLSLTPESQTFTGVLAPLSNRIFVSRRLVMGWTGSPTKLSEALAPVLQVYRQSVMQHPAMRKELAKYTTDFKLIIFSYLDDWLISFSQLNSCAIVALDILFDLLSSLDISLKLTKCSFFESELTLLGFSFKDSFVSPSFRNLVKYSQVQPPKSRKSLRQYLCSTNFYRNYVPHYATVVAELRHEVNLSDKIPFVLTERLLKAFYKLQYILANHSSLPLPKPNLQYVLQVDASCQGIGGFLGQISIADNGHETIIPVALYSRVLSKAERKYHINTLELISLADSLSFFRAYIAMTTQPIRVFSDNSTVIAWVKGKLEQTFQPQLLRLLARINCYLIDISHISSKQNFLCDFLSRMHAPDVALDFRDETFQKYKAEFEQLPMHELFQLTRPLQDENNDSTALFYSIDAHFPMCDISLDEYQSALLADTFSKAMIEYITTGHIPVYVDSRLQAELTRSRNNYIYVNNTLFRLDRYGSDNQTRLYVPFPLTRRIISHFHRTNLHPGVTSTIKSLQATYFIRNLKQAVATTLKQCRECLQYKILPKDRHLPMKNWSSVDCVNSRCFIDFLSLTVNGQSKSILIVMDAFSRFLFTRLMSDLKASTFVYTIFELQQTFGKFNEICVDQGSQFINKLFFSACRLYNITITELSSRRYRSLSVERHIQTLKTRLRLSLSHTTSHFDLILSTVTSAINNTFKPILNATPSFLYFRRVLTPLTTPQVDPQIILPMKFKTTFADLIQSLIVFHSHIVDGMESRYDPESVDVPPEFQVGSLVLICRPALHGSPSKSYHGPYTVVKIIDQQFFLADPNSLKHLQHSFSKSDLKPFYDQFYYPPHSSVLPELTDKELTDDGLKRFESLPLHSLKKMIQDLKNIDIRVASTPSQDQPFIEPTIQAYKPYKLQPYTPQTPPLSDIFESTERPPEVHPPKVSVPQPTQPPNLPVTTTTPVSSASLPIPNQATVPHEEIINPTSQQAVLPYNHRYNTRLRSGAIPKRRYGHFASFSIDKMSTPFPPLPYYQENYMHSWTIPTANAKDSCSLIPPFSNLS